MNDIDASMRLRPTQCELPGVEFLDRSRSVHKLSPKRPTEDKSGLADVFPYYAGFSYDWARACLQSHPLPHNATVLDPWNGSGTTTLAAQQEGFRAVGIDRNPVANIVARFRANAHQDPGEIVSPAEVPKRRRVREDALHAWFHPSTAARIRSWSTHLSSLSLQSANLGYVSVFRAVRKMTTYFEGSNPTWVRRAKNDDELIHLKAAEVDAAIMEEQEFVSARISESRAEVRSLMSLVTASSHEMPLTAQSVDFILTSPPYLTRIDYAVAYTRELAVMGMDIAKDRTLRSGLMGTTLIRNSGDLSEPPVGSIGSALLKDISSHSSKASSGYYKKQACQYLDDLTAGLSEISRVAKSGAFLYLVVQDSFYKDVPVRLADICAEECEMRGWRVRKTAPELVKRTLTSLNTSARRYEKSDVAETVISLEKLDS